MRYRQNFSVLKKGTKSGVTKDEILTFLLDRNVSQSFADAQIAFLVSNGNTLLYFSSETSESMKRWVYIQKE